MTRTLTQHRLQDFTKHDWQVVSDENLDAIWPYLELKTTQFPGGFDPIGAGMNPVEP